MKESTVGKVRWVYVSARLPNGTRHRRGNFMGTKKKNTHPRVVIFTQGSILADMVLPLTRHSTADDRVFKTYPLGVACSANVGTYV